MDLHHHGDVEAGAGLLDFAVNVYAGPRPAWLEAALLDGIAASSAYPDVAPARVALAARHGRAAAEVLPAAGAAEAFTLVARLRPWRRPVVVHPQFTEPHTALEAAGRHVTVALCRAGDGFRLEAAAVPGDADLVVVGNPTNPTGVLHPAAVIRSLVRPGLRDRGLVFQPSAAPFVLAQPGAGVHAALRRQGVAVRRGGTFPGLDDSWLRIAARPPAQAGRLLAARLEQRLYADRRSRGALHVAVLVGGAAALGAAADRGTGRRPLPRAAVTALATWAVLGGRSLEREALAVHRHVAESDLPAARRRLSHLVGRETAALPESEIARAVVESVAENTSDAVVAPLIWGAAAGVPGLLAYRAANTLDAMTGHHSARYERFGWAAARLDDVLNLPAARLTGVLTVACAPARAREALTAWRRDARRHPSPNAGVAEAAFAGALGIRLGGANTYGGRAEHRAVLGDGRAAAPADITRAVRLARRVGAAAALGAAIFAATRPSRR